MISSISSSATANVAEISSAQTQPQAPPVAQKKEDSVQLSPQAQAAIKGDVDHDGDSH